MSARIRSAKGLDIRRILIVFIIAILFTFLVFQSIFAVNLRPEYNDFCDNRLQKPIATTDTECESINVSVEDRQSCNDKDGNIQYDYNSNGCPVSYYCETCSQEYSEAREKYNMNVFLISAIIGLIAIVLALYLPTKEELNEWIATGFMLGGLLTIFFGTFAYIWDIGEIGRFIRPLVFLLEIVIIIFVAYKKLKE
ncbi:MAG: hypothetical protein ACLFP2_02090 [Candidatus Woesearchaeota archaeon]